MYFVLPLLYICKYLFLPYAKFTRTTYFKNVIFVIQKGVIPSKKLYVYQPFTCTVFIFKIYYTSSFKTLYVSTTSSSEQS